MTAQASRKSPTLGSAWARVVAQHNESMWLSGRPSKNARYGLSAFGPSMIAEKSAGRRFFALFVMTALYERARAGLRSLAEWPERPQ